MPHTIKEKKQLLTRVRRIKGQADALETALEQGGDCSAILQQIAAIRGAVNGLMAEVVNDAYQQEGQTADGNDALHQRQTLAQVVQNKCKQAGLGAFLR